MGKTLYCYMYSFKNNTAGRMVFDADRTYGGYAFRDDDDECVVIFDNDINKVKSQSNDEDKYVYIYSFDENINNIMNVINESLTNELEKEKKELENKKKMICEAEKAIDVFRTKMVELREKYPNGIKE